MTDITLWSFHGSNAGLTAELIFEHAGIEHRTRRVPPGLHAAALRLAGFPRPTVPALRVGDERIQGSRAIASWAAERVPDAHLLPADPDERAVVLAAEQRGERLQNVVRRLVYVHAQSNPVIVRALVDATYTGAPRPVRALVAKALVPLGSRAIAARADRLDGYLDLLVELLAEFDGLVQDGLLGTETPNVADFQIAPNLAALAVDAGMGEALRGRPCWRIAERCCPTYPLDGEVGLPAEWVGRVAAPTP
ncbi:MAG: Glutathione S-transferase domain protein [Thermoleophilia bacterium]|nr:Glutathione S-transferase domain protein [Thermoleophilia bacterium]